MWNPLLRHQESGTGESTPDSPPRPPRLEGRERAGEIAGGPHQFWPSTSIGEPLLHRSGLVGRSGDPSGRELLLVVGSSSSARNVDRPRFSPVSWYPLSSVTEIISSDLHLLVDYKVPSPEAPVMAAANGAAVHASAKAPLFCFGVIADVQYADIPDGRSFLGVPRYYRHSITVLQRAVSTWNKQNNIKFSINFGDIVDGFCPKDKSLWAVHKVLDEFDKFDGPTYHMLGNHCLYNLPRSKLVSLLKMPVDSDRAYYDFSPCSEFRIVVLDAYDFSCLGWPHDHPVTAAAMKLLDEKNPNTDKNSPDGLVGVDRRFVKFNGAVGKEQLSWLDDVLQDASTSRQSVILCSHLPMDPGASSPAALMWNYDEVMAIVRRYNCVKACFAGHDHKGGHSIDSHGVHHRTLEAALECPPGTSAFGHVQVYPDRLLLVGSDGMADTEICF